MFFQFFMYLIFFYERRAFMRKTIRFSNGNCCEMTFEEVFVEFTPLVKSVMRKSNNKFYFNKVEEEDFLQELYLELWRAYEKYDDIIGTSFTTYLYFRLQKGVRDVTYSKFSKKNQSIEISMDAPFKNPDFTLEDFLSIPDDSLNGILNSELESIVLSATDSGEEEMLQSLINRKEFSIQQYADKHTITRQAANQRIIKFRNKLRKVVMEQYFDKS